MDGDSVSVAAWSVVREEPDEQEATAEGQAFTDSTENLEDINYLMLDG